MLLLLCNTQLSPEPLSGMSYQTFQNNLASWTHNKEHSGMLIIILHFSRWLTGIPSITQFSRKAVLYLFKYLCYKYHVMFLDSSKILALFISISPFLCISFSFSCFFVRPDLNKAVFSMTGVFNIEKVNLTDCLLEVKI